MLEIEFGVLHNGRYSLARDAQPGGPKFTLAARSWSPLVIEFTDKRRGLPDRDYR